MAQNTDILLSVEHYSRADFTALRAWLNKLPISQIASLYYAEDDLLELGCAQPSDLACRLERLRDTLILRANETNPHAAEALRTARRVHVWSKLAIDYLVKAADQDMLTPRPIDPVSAWFKPRLANSMKMEGVHTLTDLKLTIQIRGHGWWKPFTRIGARKAAVVVYWLQQHAASLGELILSNSVTSTDRVILTPDNPQLLPLERVSLPTGLDGQQGFNRNTHFALISARNDLEAIDCYLYKFRGQEKTGRAYRKELERFLLWCIYERRKAMSSILNNDCEAYKDFLAAPKAYWIGPKTKRLSEHWKPFAGNPSPSSQRYAIQAIRSFFEWLVNVRYLSGNPWITTADPVIAKPIHPMQIDKALPEALWHRLITDGGLLDQLGQRPDDELRERYRLRGAATHIALSAQFRLVRAALLLLGDGGLRREEAAHARRDRLKPVPATSDLWEMDVLGKRSKWRTVFLPKRAIHALQTHWLDRGLDFSFSMANFPLLSPLVAPSTTQSQRKHVGADGAMTEAGFSEDGLYRVIKTALARIADDPTLSLDHTEQHLLRQAGPHAFRHTFGTQAAAGSVPLDVLQRVLGHASLQTTTIYIQAEKKRSIEELQKFFRKD